MNEEKLTRIKEKLAHIETQLNIVLHFMKQSKVILKQEDQKKEKDKPNKAGKRWTDDEIQKLKVSFENHPHDYYSIAVEMARTPRAIFMQLVKLGKTNAMTPMYYPNIFKPWADDESTLIDSLFNSGRTVDEIAMQIGRPKEQFIQDEEVTASPPQTSISPS